MRRRWLITLLFVVIVCSILGSWWSGRLSGSRNTPNPDPPPTATDSTGASTTARSAGDSFTVTGGPATIVLDGRRDTACFENEIHPKVATTITIPNVLTPGTCTSRLFAVAVDRALLRMVPSFTDSGGDVVSVPMSPVAQVPVAVWIGHGPPSDAQADVNTANLLFNGMQCGVTFAPVNISDRRTASGVASVATAAACDDVPALQSTLGFTSGQLNVYYVGHIDEPEGANGITCPANGGAVEVVLVANGALIETLAHEIGHTFTLGHTNGLAVPMNNLMLRGAAERDTLTTGQCIRANLNPGSSMAMAVPPRPPSAGCLPEAKDVMCPALVFDVNSQQ